MDIDSLFNSNKSIKRKFFEALHDFSQQTSPAPKKPTVEPSATDTIRVEINKVVIILVIVRFSMLIASIFWAYKHYSYKGISQV